jgi:hypothetical protein
MKIIQKVLKMGNVQDLRAKYYKLTSAVTMLKRL